MLDLFLSAPYAPFTLALALLAGLMLMELAFAILGGTLLGMGGEGLDAPGMDTPDLGDLDLDIDLDGLDLEAADLELTSFDEMDGAGGPDASGSVAAWLGFGRMPALIWLASILFAFGATGLALQSVATGLTGAALPVFAAALPAAAAALWFTRRFGALFARLLPKTETESLSERHLGRRTGTVTQGTAARGRPAEVRVTDRFGNTHYLRAEPLRDAVQIPQGAEVLVLRHRHDGGYRLVPLTD